MGIGGGIAGVDQRAAEVAGIGAQPGGSGNKTSDQELFSQVISRAKGKGGSTPQERARTAAEQLVSTALVQPVFKQLRESNNAAEPFAPNQAEPHVPRADGCTNCARMVHSSHWGLVDHLARGMLKKMGIKQATAAHKGTRAH